PSMLRRQLREHRDAQAVPAREPAPVNTPAPTPEPPASLPTPEQETAAASDADTIPRVQARIGALEEGLALLAAARVALAKGGLTPDRPAVVNTAGAESEVRATLESLKDRLATLQEPADRYS